MPELATDAVLDLLRETADAVIRPRFRHLSTGEVMEKGPGDLVTVADREAEAVITRRLLDAYPDAVVLGEEAVAADRGLLDRYAAADHGFTLDPVDGTRNFVEGRPAYAVMVAEVVHGSTVRSWIWQPEVGSGWVAERGAGAWRDGRRLTTLTPVGAGHDLVGRASRPFLSGRSAPGISPLLDTWWSCGVDYPHLAEGDADFLLYLGGGAPWDHAPGSLLVTEVGGYVGTRDGTPYDPTKPNPGIIAARSRAEYERVVSAAPNLLRRP